MTSVSPESLKVQWLVPLGGTSFMRVRTLSERTEESLFGSPAPSLRGIPHWTDSVRHDGAPPLPGRYFLLPFFIAAFFSSTTACAAANREIGTRNGDALT